MQTSTIPHNQPLCLNWTPHTLLKSQFPCTNSHSTTPHAHPTPHQPHRGSWAGPWNLMTSLSLPSWNSKPCCSPLAHSYHLHGNLTSSCFPIGFMEQDTQKGFPFSPHHPPPKKMMLSTGTWAKFSYLGFRVLWLRKYREPSSFLHSTLLSTPPWSGCFTSLLPTQKPTGNTCWAWKWLDWPTYKVGTHRKFLHPPLLPGERGKREQKYAPVKKQLGHFSCWASDFCFLPPRAKDRETPCLKAEISTLTTGFSCYLLRIISSTRGDTLSLEPQILGPISHLRDWPAMETGATSHIPHLKAAPTQGCCKNYWQN